MVLSGFEPPGNSLNWGRLGNFSCWRMALTGQNLTLKIDELVMNIYEFSDLVQILRQPLWNTDSGCCQCPGTIIHENPRSSAHVPSLIGIEAWDSELSKPAKRVNDDWDSGESWQHGFLWYLEVKNLWEHHCYTTWQSFECGVLKNSQSQLWQLWFTTPMILYYQ